MNKINIMQNSLNFEFLREDNQNLANLGGLAEALLHIDPGASVTRMRAFTEELIKVIYIRESLPIERNAKFSDLLHNDVLKSCLDSRFLRYIHFIRKRGNNAAHGGKGNKQEAVDCLKLIQELGIYIAKAYYSFDKSTLPTFTLPVDNSKQQNSEISRLKKELNEKSEKLTILLEKNESLTKLQNNKAIHVSSEQYPQKQKNSKAISDSLGWNEEQTRKFIIDKMLAEAGWDVTNKDIVEIECIVQHQETPSGIGKVDYVLWGNNKQPLAIIEAKRASSESLQQGREQAVSYANSLEKMGYERPVIFYTNGFETFIWDDTQYNTYRRVYGFYSKDSLEYLIYQRKQRILNIETQNPDEDIAGRIYQIEAVKSVAKHFEDYHRKALIVQATGTGKTRVAISITKLLLNNGWAKRILFLCDRKELRKQADDAYKDFLGTEPRFVVKDGNKIDPAARIFIATYPGMMKRFTQLDVGFFDFIIADESHRSIYNKYGDLFEYFDTLQLGLTATPVDYVARDTYRMFNCDAGDPTYEYTYDQAVSNIPPYLVPYKVKDVTTQFLQDGIHYNELSEEQQQQLEEDLGEELAASTTIKGRQIGRKILSKSTDEIILKNLMENGIKDETNTLVGKTIIFAQRQEHAEHLENLFCELYPQHGAKVCKAIHNKIAKAETLITEFKKADSDFRIAISVDMLDTGIDVPEVVNLVFAKSVLSKVKFLQMIGRGTRLCENLFGEGKDKEYFHIFDHYGNFAYFEEEYEEVETDTSKSLLQIVFDLRLELLELAISSNNTQDIRNALNIAKELIRQDINDLPIESVAVQSERRLVEKLKQTDMLNELTPTTINELKTKISPIMGSRRLNNRAAIAFDKLVTELQICFLKNAACYSDKQTEVLENTLSLSLTINLVRQKEDYLNEIQSQQFWQTPSIEKFESMRKELRGVIKYRRSNNGASKAPTTSTKDEIREDIERQVSISDSVNNLLYRIRVKKTLDEIKIKNPILKKIYQCEAVTEDEVETLVSTMLTNHPGINIQTLNTFYGRTVEDLEQTIRELVGIDAHKIEAHFTEFIHQHPDLTSIQVRMLDLLKSHLAQNGTIQIKQFNQQPFTRLAPEGLNIFTDDTAQKIKTLLEPYIYKPTQYT